MPRLLIESLSTLSLALILILQIETFGYAFRLVTGKLVEILGLDDKLEISEESDLEAKILQTLENIFLGALVFAMVFFAVGTFRFLTKEVVLYSSGIIFFGINLLSNRWIRSIRLFNIKSVLQYLKSNGLAILGTLLFFGIASVTTFRPVTQFDGVWYHLTIPKLFLQNHNIDFLGEATRYSVQPSLNYFWNLWPLSLPFSTEFNSVVINWFQTSLLAFALFYTTIVSRKKLEWIPLIQLFGPTLLGITTQTYFWFGTGYTDNYGYAFMLVAALFIFKNDTDKRTFREFLILVGLILGVSLLKVQFALIGAIFCVLVLFRFYPGLQFTKTWNYFSKFKIANTNLKLELEVPKLIYFVGISLLMFIIFVLPWLVRSYYFTGKMLYPVGNDWLTDDILSFIKAGTIEDYWQGWVWKRFSNNLVSYLTYAQTPIFGIGVLAIISTKVREKLSDFWILGVGSFLLIYFLAMVGEMRYSQPSNALVIFVGLCLINWFLKSTTAFTRLASLAMLITFVPVSILNSYGTDKLYDRLYIYRKQKMREYVYSILGPDNKFTFILNETSVRPSDLKKDELIYMDGSPNMAYIEYPVLSPFSEPQAKFQNRSTDEFIQRLKQNNIRYVVVVGNNISGACSHVKPVDSSNCETKEFKQNFTEILWDPNEKATWYQLKY
ncbi:MAG: hypothetical protein OHK0017_00630 [Patescibacteria group bacterium]